MKKFQQILTLALSLGFLAVFCRLVPDFARCRRIDGRKTASCETPRAVFFVGCERQFYERL